MLVYVADIHCNMYAVHVLCSSSSLMVGGRGVSSSPSTAPGRSFSVCVCVQCMYVRVCVCVSVCC